MRLLESRVPYRAAGGFAFEIDIEDPFQATMLAGLYDPLLEGLLRRFVAPGGTVVDAGAHLGYFTLHAARVVGSTGRVHAFECDPRLVPRLMRHVDLNGFDWVTVNACGLSDAASDDSKLYLPARLGWASVLEGVWGATEAVTVSMMRLDDYLNQRDVDPGELSLLKVDVEGSELRVLRGAAETLAATSAPVLVEFIPERLKATGEEPGALLSLMADLGYSPWSPVSGARRRGIRLIPGARPHVGEDVIFLKRAP